MRGVRLSLSLSSCLEASAAVYGTLNDEVNRVTRGTDTIISAEGAKVKVAVIATNEELVIATDTYNLTK